MQLGRNASLTTRDELLFGRPEKLKVFVSSEMRSMTLDQERHVVADAAEETSAHFAWYWERDANAGPYSSENVCIGHAKTSDCLILILADRLTNITRQEYFAAKEVGASVFIFVRTPNALDEDAKRFVESERSSAITKNFRTVADLRTSVVGALLRHVVDSARRQQLARIDYGPQQSAAGLEAEAAS